MKNYNCFSYNQMKFLMSNNIKPIHVMIHSETKRTFWIFEQSAELSILLLKWTENKNVASSKV